MKTFLMAAAAVCAFASTAAHATETVDFAGLATGTQVTSRGGVTFALSGGPGAVGPAVVTGYDGFNALSNSTTDEYPTNALMTATFGGLVNNLSFRFTNYGTQTSGRGASFYTAYDSNRTVISTGLLGSATGTATTTVTGSNIASIIFNNNTGGTDNWMFGLRSLTFDVAAAVTTPVPASVSAVPEPASWAMMIGGFGVVGGTMRRRKAVATRVAFA